MSLQLGGFNILAIYMYFPCGVSLVTQEGSIGSVVKGAAHIAPISADFQLGV